MNMEEAKEAIAKYLVGFPIDKDTLSEAVAKAGGDRDYARLFDHAPELGGEMSDEEHVGLCEIFGDHVDELSELTPRERASEWPEMYVHLSSCPSCLKLYWEVSPLWVESDLVATAESGYGYPKVLKEPIIIALRPQGSIRQLGGGLPPLEQKVMCLGEPTRPWRWELPDEDLGYTIVLEVKGGERGHAFLSCYVEPPVEPGDSFRIETTRTDATGESVPGPICDLPEERLQLELGSWSIHITAFLKDNTVPRRRWLIPLELKEDDDGI